MKTINVPESITREQYLHLIRSVGFDVTHLVSLEFCPDGIYAEVCPVNDDGTRMVKTNGAGDEVIKDRVYIPIKDEAQNPAA